MATYILVHAARSIPGDEQHGGGVLLLFSLLLIISLHWVLVARSHVGLTSKENNNLRLPFLENQYLDPSCADAELDVADRICQSHSKFATAGKLDFN